MSPPAPGDDAAAHEAAAITLAEYDRMSEAYRHGTSDHDVSQNIAALLDAIEGAPAPCHPRPRLRAGPRPARLRSPRARGRGARRRGRAGGARARRERLHGAAPGFPDPRPAARAFRRDLRQRLALPRAEQSDRAGARRARRGAETQGRALLLEPARRQPGGLGRRALRLLLRPGRPGAPSSPARASPSFTTTTGRPARPRDQQPWLATVWRKCDERR